MRTARIVVIIALVLSTPSIARAGLLFTLERISDIQTTITASGTFDPTTPTEGPSVVFLIDPFGSFVDGSTVLANNTMVTDRPASLLSVGTADSLTAGGSLFDMLSLVFSAKNVAGDTISGSVDLTLPGGALAPVGSTGQVWYGINDGDQVVTQTGTWEIVGAAAAPIPSTPVLLAMALPAMLVMRRRRQLPAAATKKKC